jgi:hypothetical protein
MQTGSHEALANVSATQGLGGMAHVPCGNYQSRPEHEVENFGNCEWLVYVDLV